MLRKDLILLYVSIICASCAFELFSLMFLIDHASAAGRTLLIMFVLFGLIDSIVVKHMKRMSHPRLMPYILCGYLLGLTIVLYVKPELTVLHGTVAVAVSMFGYALALAVNKTFLGK